MIFNLQGFIMLIGVGGIFNDFSGFIEQLDSYFPLKTNDVMYFKRVWKIWQPSHLLANIFLLIYCTLRLRYIPTENCHVTKMKLNKLI